MARRFIIIYCFGLPGFVSTFVFCRNTDIDFPHRELVGVVLNIVGSVTDDSVRRTQFRST